MRRREEEGTSEWGNGIPFLLCYIFLNVLCKRLGKKKRTASPATAKYAFFSIFKLFIPMFLQGLVELERITIKTKLKTKLDRDSWNMLRSEPWMDVLQKEGCLISPITSNTVAIKVILIHWCTTTLRSPTRVLYVRFCPDKFCLTLM
jgi:hypothetical protein